MARRRVNESDVRNGEDLSSIGAGGLVALSGVSGGLPTKRETCRSVCALSL